MPSEGPLVGVGAGAAVAMQGQNGGNSNISDGGAAVVGALPTDLNLLKALQAASGNVSSAVLHALS